MHLTATHTPTGESARFKLSGRKFLLGRATSADPENKLAVGFDPKLSRKTALLEVKAGFLSVKRDQSRYPLFHEGSEREQFDLFPGQKFSSGETVFELHSEAAHTLTQPMLERVNQGNSERILKVLLNLQPLLNQWRSPVELANESVQLLKGLVPSAQVAFFQLDSDGEAAPLTPSSLRPSRSLLSQCLKEKLPAYHLWTPTAGTDQPTQFANESWALAAPILSSSEQLVLYAVGREFGDTPGELERAALALVAQILGQHLEGRRSLVLEAQVEAEARANRKLRILLDTVERAVSLQSEEVIEEAFLEGARQIAEAEIAEFSKDLRPLLKQEQRSARTEKDRRAVLSVAFKNFRPQGILCRNDSSRPFSQEQEDWLVALSDFAETVLQNRRLHRRVRSSLSQLKESQEQLVLSSQWAAAGRLAANAAHELNTPLGAIKLSAETSLMFLSDGPKPARDNQGLILRAVERCRKVTERLLVYSRPSVEKSIEIFSLSAVVEDSLGTIQPFLKSLGILAEQELDDSIRVTGDVQDCYWAVTNIMKNAVDALAETKSPGTIRLSSRTKGGRAVLTLEDSGPGISEELREKVFEPFFTTKIVGQGNGLGLAISRDNLRSWGGDITLGQSPLGGACFTLSLPCPD